MSHPPVPDKQWKAGRELMEGAAPTQARVSEAMGIVIGTLAKKAGAEAWKTLDFRPKVVVDAQAHMIDVALRTKAGLMLERIDYRRTSRDGVLRFRGEADPDAGGSVPGAGGEAVVASFDPPELGDLPPVERAARLKLMLTRRIEAVLSRAEAGGTVEARNVAALSALAQLAERIAPVAVVDEEAAEREAVLERDERIAAALEKVNARIIYLSRAFAAQILTANGMDRAAAEAAVAAYGADQSL